MELGGPPCRESSTTVVPQNAIPHGPNHYSEGKDTQRKLFSDDERGQAISH